MCCGRNNIHRVSKKSPLMLKDIKLKTCRIKTLLHSVGPHAELAEGEPQTPTPADAAPQLPTEGVEARQLPADDVLCCSRAQLRGAGTTAQVQRGLGADGG